MRFVGERQRQAGVLRKHGGFASRKVVESMKLVAYLTLPLSGPFWEVYGGARFGYCGSVVSALDPKANYAINPTPELDLRSNRAVLPARVIAALEIT